MLGYEAIPRSESDILLDRWGFDLIDDYFSMITAAEFPGDITVVDFATGTGRAASVLSRLGYRVLTGDYNSNLRSDSITRITEKFLDKVNFVRLNLEKIPLPDNSAPNVVCINTLHELENPFMCIDEMIRVHFPDGRLLIADFNSEGFDVMDRLHLVKHGLLHPRGKISSEEIKKILISKYSCVKEINSKLNTGFIASGMLNK